VTDVDTITTLFHCSDLHFGHPAVPEQYEAIEAIIQERRFDVVAISGDVSQRARAGEFQRARVFIQHAERWSKTIVVPGNHDVAWWYSPLGVGDTDKMFAKYRAYINRDLEPALRVAGATSPSLSAASQASVKTHAGGVSYLGSIGGATWNAYSWQHS